MATLKVLTRFSQCLRCAKNSVTNYVFVSLSSTNYQLYLIEKPTPANQYSPCLDSAGLSLKKAINGENSYSYKELFPQVI